jgi:hypothetical protein
MRNREGPPRLLSRQHRQAHSDGSQAAQHDDRVPRNRAADFAGDLVGVVGAEIGLRLMAFPAQAIPGDPGAGSSVAEGAFDRVADESPTEQHAAGVGVQGIGGRLRVGLQGEGFWILDLQGFPPLLFGEFKAFVHKGFLKFLIG